MLVLCTLALQGLAQPTKITWPEAYLPETAKFFVHNEIDVNAPPEAVWELLVEAAAWPTWYEGAEDVEITPANDGRLHAGSSFTWKTMGLRFTSDVNVFEPPYRLDWESKKKSIQGYHAWLIIPTETGCRVITDESQKGWLTFLEKTFQPNKLKRLHDAWLGKIKEKAEASAPPLSTATNP